MGVFILYIVSLGLFWVASLVAPIFFVPFLRTFKVFPTPLVTFLMNIVTSVLLMFLTRYIWLQLGYEIGWFPVLVAVQNFLASRSAISNETSKAQSNGIVAGSILFLGYSLI